MTPLRAKMMRELRHQRMAPATITAYVTAVEDLAKHYKRSPDRISLEESRSFLDHLQVEKKLSFNTCNQKICGLKFFYRRVLGQEGFDLKVSTKRPRKLPEVLSPKEVSRLIAAAKNIKHRVFLMTVYGGGLRVGEATRLQCTDIQSDRMMIRVDQGKGRKDRYTILAKRLLEELRVYYKKVHPKQWLFTDKTGRQPMHIDTAQKIYYFAKKRAGLTRGRGIHTLRHCFACHSLEAGVNIRTIQQWLGHKHLSTTLQYIHVAAQQSGRIQSPLDLLPPPEQPGAPWE
jgi:integrase/recombinase XerD